MVKQYTDGRHYSKRKIAEYKDGEAAQIEKPEITNRVEDFEKCIDLFCKNAAEMLQSYKLPAAPLVYRCRKSGRWRPAEAMPDRGRIPGPGEVKTIVDHVKDQGYDRDSAPDIAARILSKGYAMKQAKTHNEAVHAAFWMGFDVAYGTVYGLDGAWKSKGGKTSRYLTTIWAPLLAEYMVQRNPKIDERGVEDRLIRLGVEGLRLDAWNITINEDGEIAAEHLDGRRSEIAFSSFEKRYLRPAKK